MESKSEIKESKINDFKANEDDQYVDSNSKPVRRGKRKLFPMPIFDQEVIYC
jgi:hypothetical protein